MKVYEYPTRTREIRTADPTATKEDSVRLNKKDQYAAPALTSSRCKSQVPCHERVPTNVMSSSDAGREEGGASRSPRVRCVPKHANSVLVSSLTFDSFVGWFRKPVRKSFTQVSYSLRALSCLFASLCGVQGNWFLAVLSPSPPSLRHVKPPKRDA